VTVALVKRGPNLSQSTPDVDIPATVWARFRVFLLTGGTGSFQFNVREGKVLGGTLTEHVKPD
jgi:hypothetical protein